MVALSIDKRLVEVCAHSVARRHLVLNHTTDSINDILPSATLTSHRHLVSMHFATVSDVGINHRLVFHAKGRLAGMLLVHILQVGGREGSTWQLEVGLKRPLSRRVVARDDRGDQITCTRNEGPRRFVLLEIAQGGIHHSTGPLMAHLHRHRQAGASPPVSGDESEGGMPRRLCGDECSTSGWQAHREKNPLEKNEPHGDTGREDLSMTGGHG
mmetsp:Transcript_26864/g.77124  ORF Transcript_26864/g.77124 Transcript_26864/m.77124 type:complete len:213 (+) Transcript_26864:2283-2921(+)